MGGFNWKLLQERIEARMYPPPPRGLKPKDVGGLPWGGIHAKANRTREEYEARLLADPTMPRRKPMAPVVYLMRSASGLLKIGWTQDIAARLSSIRTANAEEVTLLATLPGERDLEKEI